MACHPCQKDGQASDLLIVFVACLHEKVQVSKLQASVTLGSGNEDVWHVGLEPQAELTACR